MDTANARIEIRCPHCKKRLFDTDQLTGNYYGKCPRCKKEINLNFTGTSSFKTIDAIEL